MKTIEIDKGSLKEIDYTEEKVRALIVFENRILASHYAGLILFLQYNQFLLNCLYQFQ